MHAEHAVEIDAPIETVWAATIDIERWPDITPTMNKIERLDDGPIRIGSRATIRQPRLPKAVWTVTELDPPVTFRWHGRMIGVDWRAAHLHEPLGDDRSKLTLTVDGAGIAATLLGPVLKGQIAAGIASEAAGFKAWCERAT